MNDSKFMELNNAEIIILQRALYILIDDYEHGVWDDKYEYVISLQLYKKLENKLKERGFAND